MKNPGVPEQLDELVLWATEKSPDERPVDAREMLERLREIERDLGISPQVARTPPAGVARETTATGDLTAVLPVAASGPTAAVGDIDNSTRLRRATRRRQAKGWWLVAIVVLLAILAAAVGWWFGSGPGSLVGVPDVAGKTFAEAQTRLAEDSLVAVEDGRNSLDVAPGVVIGTEPSSGTRVDKDSEVKVLVSLGPAEVQVERLIDKTETEARGILQTNFIAVAEDSEEYFTDSAADVVVGTMLAPADGSAPFACGEGCTAHQGDSATLWVSLGPVPDVTGQSEGSARSTLEGLQLVVADPSPTEPSDTVDEGKVIRMIGRDDGAWLRPGDTVTLVVSSGPPLFPIPNLTGKTLAQARDAATKAGFTISYDDFWDGAPDPFTEVKSQKPGAGEMRVKGTDIALVVGGVF